MFRTEKLSNLRLYIDTANGEVFSQQKGLEKDEKSQKLKFFVFFVYKFLILGCFFTSPLTISSR